MAYLAPEVLCGKVVNQSVDVYRCVEYVYRCVEYVYRCVECV